MLAAHKHNASALFGYTQRYHGPRAAIKTSGARDMICSVRSCWKGFVTCFPLFSFSPLAIVSKIIIKMPFNFEGMTMSETLTQDQIAFYQENGYLVLENQIPDSWMHRIRREISRFEDEAALLSESNERLDLEDTHTKNAPRLRRIKLPHTISTDLKELMLSDYILGPARDLAGPNLRLHTSKPNMKSAGYGAAVEWHQDYAFYPHTNDDILAIGVIIDDNLTWDAHIDYLETLLNSKLILIKRIRRYIPESEYSKIYEALFVSHLTYCISSWGGIPKYRLNKIFSIQKRCMRLLFW